MNLKIKNKKAQIPSTLVWVAGTFIIFFIMILYVVFGGIAYLDHGKSSIIPPESAEKFSRVYVADSLLNFLDSKTSNGETIYEILSKADSTDKDEARIKIFQDESLAFLEKTFPENEDNTVGSFAVYSLNTKDGQYYSMPDYTITLASRTPGVPNMYSFKIPIGSDKYLEVAVYKK